LRQLWGALQPFNHGQSIAAMGRSVTFTFSKN